MKLSDIQIRDPFILPVENEGKYYLFGTTAKDPWNGPFDGLDCYVSHDLENWDGPKPAFRPPDGFWGTRDFWAPEVHFYGGRYWMFVSFKAENRCRATQILIADYPWGPFVPRAHGPATPPDWECLDGTLFVDEEGQPWMVFCHEWVQIQDGAICALRLSGDLNTQEGEPVQLFHASEAGWVKKMESGTDAQNLVTDGPFLHRTADGILLMLWSSFGEQGYAMGLARSDSGKITGPWVQLPEPLWARDGGHGMIFRTFDGRLCLILHQPNHTPLERPVIRELTETNGLLELK